MVVDESAQNFDGDAIDSANIKLLSSGSHEVEIRPWYSGRAKLNRNATEGLVGKERSDGPGVVQGVRGDRSWKRYLHCGSHQGSICGLPNHKVGGHRCVPDCF